MNPAGIDLWQVYEIEKAKIVATVKDAAEYERRIRELVDKLRM